MGYDNDEITVSHSISFYGMKVESYKGGFCYAPRDQK